MRALAITAALVALLLPSLALGASTSDLVKLLGDGSDKVRVKAALLLGKGGDPAAVPALSRTLETDDSETVRAASAAALGAIGHEGGRKALLSAGRDPSRLVRDAANKALALVEKSGGGSGGAVAAMAVDALSGTLSGPLGERFRVALGAELQKAGFELVATGKVDKELRSELGKRKGRAFAVKPSVLSLTVTPGPGKTVFETKVSGIVVEPGGRVETISEASAKLTVGSDKLSDAQRSDYSLRALQAAARSLAAEIRSRL